MPLIDLDAAIAALTERQSNYREESTTWAQIGLDILTIRALPTVQPEPAPALGAEWMRREAEKAILALWQWDDEGWQTHRPNNSEARAAILAIPGPTRAQLLADAEAFGYDYARTIGAALAKLKGGAV